MEQQKLDLDSSDFRLFPDQTATFVRDISFLQHELQILKSQQDIMQSDLAALGGKQTLLLSDLARKQEVGEAHRAAMENRLTYIEDLIGDDVEKHAETLDLPQGPRANDLNHATSWATIAKRLLYGVEESFDEMATGQILNESKSYDVQHVTMIEHFENIEKTIGNSIEKQTLELEAVHTQIENLLSRFSACEARGVVSQAVLMEEPFNTLQGAIRETMDRHVQELQAAHAKIDQLGDHMLHDFDRCIKHDALINGLLKDKEEHLARENSILSRLEHFEHLLYESTNKIVQQFQTINGDFHHRISLIEHKLYMELIVDVNSEKDLSFTGCGYMDSDKLARIMHARNAMYDMIEEEKLKQEQIC